MDIATTVGIVTGSSLVLPAMGDPGIFFNLPSVLIAVGGTIS